MNNSYKIYVLKDPISLEIRYVGLTKNATNRLYSHIKDVNRKGRSSKTHKANWIRTLLNKNILPLIEIIEDGLSLNEVEEKEIYYIKMYRSLGYNLTNIAEGGSISPAILSSVQEKIKQKHWSKSLSAPEIKKILSESAKSRTGTKNPFYNKKHTEEFKEKMRNARKGIALKPSKKVHQFSLDGSYIKTWNSMKSIGEFLNIEKYKNIRYYIRMNKPYMGFIWKY